MTNLAGSPDKATSKPRDEESSDALNHPDSNKLSPDLSTHQPQCNPLGNSSTQQPDKESKSAEWVTQKSRKDAWNPPSSDQDAKTDHRTADWRECFNNYCPAHLLAKQDWGWFPTRADRPYDRPAPSTRQPSTPAPSTRQTPSPQPKMPHTSASSTRRPKMPHTSRADHASLSWTVCYDSQCESHLAAKQDWGWFPSHCRYVYGKPWPTEDRGSKCSN